MALDSEFDAYLVVDWSANNRPKQGLNSVWYYLIEQAGERGEPRYLLRNPQTRVEAFREVCGLLKDLAERRRSTLVGFDFAYGYPSGFAQALKLNRGSPWQSVWQKLQAEVLDDELNRSNRFEVAAGLNRAISGGDWPFWGCPQGRNLPNIRPTRSAVPPGAYLSEFRLTESRQRGPQPVWKLCYPGSVGSQALLGIPYLARLRDDPVFGSWSRVWPFETSFALAPRSTRDWTILHAEVYPSLLPLQTRNGECKDAAQVRGLADFFYREDRAGRLRQWFEPPTALRDEQLATSVAEEGWILGVR